MEFRLEKLGPLTLATVTGNGGCDDRERVAQDTADRLEMMLDAQGVECGRRFFAEMNVGSGIYHAAYAEIDVSAAPGGGVRVVRLPNEEFAAIDMPDVDFAEAQKLAFSGDFRAWMRANGFVQDMSEVLYICERTEDGFTFYAPIEPRILQ